jgi:hypothetical protein
MKVWREAVKTLVRRSPPPRRFNAGDVAGWMGLTYAYAAQLLGRLQGWGHVRLVGFAPAKGGIGRRRKVYEVTPHGVKAARYRENGE